MNLDIPLLLSIVGGLGKSETQPEGHDLYIRDDDCIGALAPMLAAVLGMSPR